MQASVVCISSCRLPFSDLERKIIVYNAALQKGCFDIRKGASMNVVIEHS